MFPSVPRLHELLVRHSLCRVVCCICAGGCWVAAALGTAGGGPCRVPVILERSRPRGCGSVRKIAAESARETCDRHLMARDGESREDERERRGTDGRVYHVHDRGRGRGRGSAHVTGFVNLR